jgi:hypothetical protein
MYPDHRDEKAKRLAEEHARSHGHLKRFHADNPGVLSNPETYQRAHDLMTDAQADDLERAGLIDRELFRKQTGRDVRASEIHDAHLSVGAHAPHRVRGASELIDHVHRRLASPRRGSERHDQALREAIDEVSR